MVIDVGEKREFGLSNDELTRACMQYVLRREGWNGDGRFNGETNFVVQNGKVVSVNVSIVRTA